MNANRCVLMMTMLMVVGGSVFAQDGTQITGRVTTRDGRRSIAEPVRDH
jgi:hypothetical protein